MDVPIQASYNTIIAHTVKQALKLSANINSDCTIAGFCQLQGPTGIGKSSSLYRSPDKKTLASLELIKSQGLQAILVTHRWNILHDIYESTTDSKDSSGCPFTASILYAQDETVISAISQRPLPHEQDIQKTNFPDPFKAIEEIKHLGGFYSQNESEALVQTCYKVLAIARNVDYKKKNPEFMGVLLEHEEQELKKLCSYVERAVLRCMSKFEKEIKQATKRFGKDHELVNQARKKLKTFRLNQWVRRVLPAIVWRDERQHLLIMTTQKLFASFYDGQQKVRMSSEQLAGKVVFIDEFDYQADILQALLAQSQMVQEPPECIGQLLEGGKRLLARMQYVSSEPVPELYLKLKQLLDNLEKDLKTKGINLSQSRALVVPLTQYESGTLFPQKYLFRSDHLITSEPLTLEQTTYGFEVKSNRDEDKVNIDVGDFLRVMEKYVRRFSLLLSDFATDESEAYEYLVRLNRLLFDPVNDYRPSYYSTALPNLSLFSLPRTSVPELTSLRQSNLLPNSHINMLGLTTWLLKTDEADADLDPLRVKIKRALLPTTPEGLLVSLASRNLVFALSATSYIERAIGHFDIRWIESALKYVAQARNPHIHESFLGDKFDTRPEEWFNKPVPYLQMPEDKDLQLNIIKSLVKEKSDLRKSILKTYIHDFKIAIKHDKFEEAKQHLSADFFEAVSSEFKYNYRKDVLFKLIQVLCLASKSSNHKGHLVFVNSIKYIRKWLLSSAADNSRLSCEWLAIESDLFVGTSEERLFKDFSDIFIPAQIDNKPIIICLLNAEAQKKKGFGSAYQAAFDSGRTVIILTQTASATNGINLDYSLPDIQEQMDLTALYVVESKHFYFSHWDKGESDDEMAHAGFQLRNLEKLVKRSELSRKQQRQFIMPLMSNSIPKIQELNKIYKGSSDFIKNLAADVQQQVGRIERAWNYVPNVEIHLCDEIASHLHNYAHLTVYINNRQLVSHLNNLLLDNLIKITNNPLKDLVKNLITQSQDGSKAVKIIDNQLVPAIRDARDGKVPLEQLTTIWYDLGRAVLQYDLSWKPQRNFLGITEELKHWACFKKPDESLQTNEVWYDPNSWQFFAHHAPGLIKYDLQSIYKVVQSHPAIIEWFNWKGYRTALQPYANDLEEQYGLHPVVVQRILQGRIGEEAIRALLNVEQLKTTQRMQNHELFELYDFEVIKTSTFIDAKYWSSRSMEQSEDEFEQWISAGKKPEFAPLGLINKLNKIRALRGGAAILVIANLVTNEQNCYLSGFSDLFEPVKNMEQASIIFLSGCLSSQSYMATSGFNQLVKLLKRRLKDQL